MATSWQSSLRNSVCLSSCYFGALRPKYVLEILQPVVSHPTKTGIVLAKQSQSKRWSLIDLWLANGVSCLSWEWSYDSSIRHFSVCSATLFAARTASGYEQRTGNEVAVTSFEVLFWQTVYRPGSGRGSSQIEATSDTCHDVFTAAKFNKIFSCDQPCQHTETSERFSVLTEATSVTAWDSVVGCTRGWRNYLLQTRIMSRDSRLGFSGTVPVVRVSRKIRFGTPDFRGFSKP